MELSKAKRQQTPNKISKIFACNREYPVIDKIVVIYVAVLLFFQILLQISPAMSFLATTPLYSIQTYLGLLGGLLIVVDLFTTKKIWQGKFCICLYAILVLAALASVRTISYGTKENLFKLCWAAIQFVLIYSCVHRMDSDSLKRYIRTLFYILLAIWFVACCVSLYQFVNQIGYKYVVNPLAKDSSSNRQGFYDNRLFGIFYTLNHAAFISVFFVLINLMCIMKDKRIWVKIVLGVAELVILCHIILSGSRSAALSLLVCLTVMAWFVARNVVRQNGVVKIICPIVVAALVAVVAVGGFKVMKAGLARVPYWKELLVYQMQQNENEAPTEESTEAPTEETTEAPTEETTEAPTEETTEPPIAPPEYEEDLLVRDHLEEDASNGRFSIWKDYISLYKEIGLLGLSPGNYMPHILENYPDLYIVEYIRQEYPDKYESGIIYHVHSGYVMVYVSAGILGFAFLAIFMALCLIRVVAIIIKNKKMSYTFIGAFTVVLAGAISAVFDEGLFFQNTPHTTMFWFALGVLLMECLAEVKSRKN